MIVDSGAWTNLIGEDLAKNWAETARQHGHDAHDRRLKIPVNVAGVGEGAQSCHWELVAPCGVPRTDGEIGPGTFTSPVVQGGAGQHLPALLGLRSMEQQRAILDTAGRTLILPGPGAVEMQLPPGSVLIPLEKAPSGHLVMVVDDYAGLKQQTAGGLAPRMTHFLADPAEGTEQAQDATRYTTRAAGDTNITEGVPEEDRCPQEIAYDDDAIDAWLASRRDRASSSTHREL